MQESKHEKFIRLATARGNRVLRDLELLGNLSHKGNYEYTEEDVQKLFAQIDNALKETRSQFHTRRTMKEIKF